MGDELLQNLEEECKRQLEELETLDTGSEEAQRATGDLVKLLNVLKEREKEVGEYDIAYRELEQKSESDKKALEEAKKDRKTNWIQFGITTALTIGTTIASHVWLKNRYHEGLQFEREGTYTARGGAQNIMRQFKLPKL